MVHYIYPTRKIRNDDCNNISHFPFSRREDGTLHNISCPLILLLERWMEGGGGFNVGKSSSQRE